MYAHLFKANPYHDDQGLFTSKNKATFASIGGVFDRQKSRIREKDAPTAGNSARDINDLRSRGLKIDFDADQWMASSKGKMRPRDLIQSVVGAGGGKLGGKLSLDKNTARLELKDTEAHGALFRDVKQKISFSKGEATHVLLRVKDADTGAGAVKKMYSELLPLYERAGINKIKLAANLEAGAHAWAKYGFTADDPGQYAREFRAEAQRMGRSKMPGDAKKDLMSILSLTQMVEDHKYNTHMFSDIKAPALDRYLNQGIPRSKWRSATKRLSSDLTWTGSLDLKDKRQTDRLKAYIKPKKPG